MYNFTENISKNSYLYDNLIYCCFYALALVTICSRHFENGCYVEPGTHVDSSMDGTS